MVFFTLIEDCPAAQTFVKAGPYLKSPATKSHVSAIPQTTEIGEFEPRRSVAIHHPSLVAKAICQCTVAFRLSFYSQRKDAAGNHHDPRVLKLAYQFVEPVRLRDCIIVYKSYNLRFT